MGVFDDATVRNIGRAFDLACQELNDAGQPDVVHEVMIQRIIAAARNDERDVKRLRDVGLTGLRVCPDTLGRITKFSKHEPN